MDSAAGIDWSMRLQVRPDLRIDKAPVPNLAAPRYSLYDPLTRNCYRVGAIELAVLEACNGRRTLKQVFGLVQGKSEFSDLSPNRLGAVITQFRNAGLFLGARSQATNSHRTGFSVSALVSWQLRGINPDRWLDRIAVQTDWLFSGRAVAFWLCMVAATAVLVLLEFSRLASQATQWNWILHPAQGTMLLAVFLVTRALHECGHAIVCKRHGVRCPDIGLFFVLGAPCVYCDVSDSARLVDRWQRSAIAAAGMYVELVIAAAAAWAWMLTIDGPFNTLALQTMIVCSVSTVLINMNPLMRFDGYYILSDILDEPNLRGRADGLASTWLYAWVLGKRTGLSKGFRNTRELGLWLFSWLGWLYRAGLSIAIAIGIYSLYAYWQLAWIGRILAIATLITWWGGGAMKALGEMDRLAKPTRTRWRLALFLCLVVGGGMYAPIPYRQQSTGWLQPSLVSGVFATQEGTLESQLARSGEIVQLGQPLFQLRNDHHITEWKRAQSAEERAKIQLVAHQRNRIRQDTLEIDLAPAEAAVDNAKRRSNQSFMALQQLTILAPSTGRLQILASPNPQLAGQPMDSSTYGSWSDPRALGRSIRTGTMLAAVCSDDYLAIIPLSDSQMEWVKEGGEVRLHLRSQQLCLHGQIQSIISLREDAASLRLLQPEQEGHPAEHAYAAVVTLPPSNSYQLGSSVEAVFIAPSQTLVTLGRRWLQGNLRWLVD